jgi:O-antigen ligase
MSTKRPTIDEATTMMEGRDSSRVRVRSPLSLLSDLAILLALPAAIGYLIQFGSGGGTTIHLALAAGCLLLAFSVFDFELPRWINRTGCVAALALGTNFLLQAHALLTPNESLHYVAYPVLGHWVEGGLAGVIILWFVAMLLIFSRGKTRLLGSFAMSLAVCFEVYSQISSYLGTSSSTDAGTLKLLLLLPFVWLLFESTMERPKQGS